MGHQTAEAHSSSLVCSAAPLEIPRGVRRARREASALLPRLRVTPTETVCKNVQPEVLLPPSFPSSGVSKFVLLAGALQKGLHYLHPAPRSRSALKQARADAQNRRVHTRCGRRTFWMTFMKNTDSKDGEKNSQMNHPPDLPRKKKKRKTRGG